MRLLFSVLLAFFCFCVPVNAQGNAAEGAGLIVSDSEGALPKGLWRKNHRSEITYLLKNLPAEAPFKSLQEIKRNMLISTYETSDIIDDVQIAIGEDLLTLRLLKLLELGLWDDAHKLYTKTTDDPGQNNRLGEIGILLALYKQGIPTACLENKAYGTRFLGTFWDQMELICGAELDNQSIISTQFPNSDVLRMLYTDPDYILKPDELAGLTIIELIMVQKKGKIDYSDFSLSPTTPPHVLRAFLSDKRFPMAQKPSLESLAKAKVVIPPLLSKSEKSPQNGNFDNQPSNNIQNNQENSWFSQIIFYAENNQKIPNNLALRLRDSISSEPENMFYFQLLTEFGLIDTNQRYPDDEIQESMRNFAPEFNKELKILKSWLDNSSEFSNNPVKVYEKQINLPLDEELLSHSNDWTEWLGKTTSHQLAGVSLLIVLNNNKNYGVRSERLLNDLRNVGLIEQSYQVARDMTARLMRITN